MLADYLTHDEIFQSLGLRSEEVENLIGRKRLSMDITIHIYHTIYFFSR